MLLPSSLHPATGFGKTFVLDHQATDSTDVIHIKGLYFAIRVIRAIMVTSLFRRVSLHDLPTPLPTANYEDIAPGRMIFVEAKLPGKAVEGLTVF
jgi:hypothetical protein